MASHSLAGRPRLVLMTLVALKGPREQASQGRHSASATLLAKASFKASQLQRMEKCLSMAEAANDTDTEKGVWSTSLQSERPCCAAVSLPLVQGGAQWTP